MDIFGEHWTNHAEKIRVACEKFVKDDDYLLLAGDLSWALKKNQALPDLEWLSQLPGHKIVCKGNHDYWWDSDKRLEFTGLHDTPFAAPDRKLGVAATRGWIPPQMDHAPDQKLRDSKIMAREVLRLRRRLEAIADCQVKIAMVHYPPALEFLPLMREFNVQEIVYGHVHINGTEQILQPTWHGIKATCTACDRINFTPKLLFSL